MEESLLPNAEKGTIGIPGPTEIDCLSWNTCGGSFIIGCWFGICLLPLVQLTRPKHHVVKHSH